MDKITAFKITSLTVSGFKNFSEPRSFTFGNMNAISGHNGQGKTSIAEAIAYAVTGVPYFGGEHSLDRLYAQDTKDLSVELTLEDDNGAAHTLGRTRCRDKTEINWDDATIRQSDLTAMFGEKDVFLSIFNPLYFIEVLGEKGRNLLERYLPSIPHEDVLARLNEHDRVLLAKERLGSPEATLDKLRGEIRDMESTITYTEGQRDLLNTQQSEGASALAHKQAEYNAAKDEWNALNTKKVNGLNFNAMEQQRAALYARRDELSLDAKNAGAETSSVTQTLETRRAETYQSKYAAHIGEAQAAFDNAAGQYKREAAVLAALKPGVTCPMCKQAVTEGNIGAVRQAFSDSVTALVAKGKELRGQLNELLEMDEQAQTVFEQYKADDIKKYEARLAELAAPPENDALAQINGQIQALETAIQYGNLSPEEFNRMGFLMDEGNRLFGEINALDAASKADPAEKIAELTRLDQAISQKRKLEAAVKSYIAARAGLLFADFSLLRKVQVILYDVVKKTGEAKNVFKFSYDGKPYHYLSLSEKIKAGLEISELMKRLSGRDYPVFIDNGESVPVIDNIRPTGQVFVAQVDKAAPLTVTVMDRPPQQAAA